MDNEQAYNRKPGKSPKKKQKKQKTIMKKEKKQAKLGFSKDKNK